MEIERQVLLDTAPIRVGAALARSPWRSAMRIEPAGAGCRVLISAAATPDGVAQTIEAMALAEVCELRSRLGADADQPPPGPDHREQPIHIKTTRRYTMTTLSLSITIDASSDEVWETLADFGGVAAWNPSVKESRLTSSAVEGAGVSRECVLAPMGTVQERVTEWTDGRLMGIEIYDHKNLPGLRSAVATIELESQGPTTVVHCQMDYAVGLGVIGAGMNAMGMRRLFTKSLGGLLAGLKHHVETGEPVDGRTRLDVGAIRPAA